MNATTYGKSEDHGRLKDEIKLPRTYGRYIF